MNLYDASTTEPMTRTNGSGAAAILSAAVGSFALAIVALIGDKSAAVKSNLNVYKPTGPLSGVTDIAILVWLVLWVVLELRWRKKSVASSPICIASLVLLGLSFLLTFPPSKTFSKGRRFGANVRENHKGLCACVVIGIAM
jgi:hypothetical protein